MTYSKVAVLIFLINNAFALESTEKLIIEQLKKSIYEEYDLKEEAPKRPKVIKSRVEYQNKKLEDALERNRRILREKSKRSKQRSQKKDLFSNKQDEWMAFKKDQVDSWENEKIRIIKNWEEAKKDYMKNVKSYMKTTTKIEAPKAKVQFKKNTDQVIKNNIKNLRSSSEFINNLKMVDKALSIPVKDQGKRPTCSAFAGVRAMEIKLAQSGKLVDLSEQHFYYLSKPSCQSSKCSNRGSWVLNAFRSRAGVSLEQNCPYKKKNIKNNETQVPLSKECLQGTYATQSFIELNSFEQMKKSLSNNHPIVGAFKLNEGFYDNKGHVFTKTTSNRIKLDQHSAGHAIAIIGWMSLPKKVAMSEGPYCFIVSNSWGAGWGVGGYSCLSQKWMERHMYDTPFISVRKVN
tara:strand:+ start:125898 stop:127109 length:1212 start_codon:yes stop_codon:yes gene_type:complete